MLGRAADEWDGDLRVGMGVVFCGLGWLACLGGLAAGCWLDRGTRAVPHFAGSAEGPS